jgi:hypothetical protein
MKKKVHSIELVGSNLLELQGNITKMIQAARLACNGKNWGGACGIDVEDGEGNELAGIDLIEETLSDQSKVYNVVMRFSNV